MVPFLLSLTAIIGVAVVLRIGLERALLPKPPLSLRGS